jgi:Ca-activated chloride channel family protein
LGRLGIAALILAAALGAQQQKDTVFSVDVKLVRLLVTVKDKAGKLVGSLDKGDFRVFDSGVEQQVAVFEHNTAQPLNIALVMDTSGSAAKDLRYAIDSAGKFLAALTREGNSRDALTFFTFNHEVTRQFGFTRNHARLRDASKNLKAEAGTSLYDALCFATDALEDREGRRVVIVITDGGDTTSKRDFHYTLKAAHRADAAIYSIVVVPITNDSGRNIGGEHALIQFANSTGGRTFFPSVGPALDNAFSQILRDLRTQYLVGYYPRNLPPSTNPFRTVRVELAPPDLTASTRTGYYQ